MLSYYPGFVNSKVFISLLIIILLLGFIQLVVELIEGEAKWII